MAARLRHRWDENLHRRARVYLRPPAANPLTIHRVWRHGFAIVGTKISTDGQHRQSHTEGALQRGAAALTGRRDAVPYRLGRKSPPTGTGIFPLVCGDISVEFANRKEPSWPALLSAQAAFMGCRCLSGIRIRSSPPMAAGGSAGSCPLRRRCWWRISTRWTRCRSSTISSGCRWKRTTPT